MTSEELDKIAELAHNAIVKFNAQSSWMYDVGLWIPDEYLPMKQVEINSIIDRIFKLAKKGDRNDNL